MRPLALALRVYFVPTRPAKVQLLTLTTPEAAVRPAHEASVPLEALREIVVVALVTMLPAESSTFTTGCVDRTAPEAPPTGWVVKTNFAGAPTTTLKPLLVT